VADTAGTYTVTAKATDPFNNTGQATATIVAKSPGAGGGAGGQPSIPTKPTAPSQSNPPSGAPTYPGFMFSAEALSLLMLLLVIILLLFLVLLMLAMSARRKGEKVVFTIKP